MELIKRESQWIGNVLDNPKNLRKFSLFWGTLGGASLISVPFLTTRGPAIFIPYAILVVGYFLLIKRTATLTFAQRFKAGLASFMLASLMLYFYIILIANPNALVRIPLFGHFWRLAFMLGIGIVINAALAFLQDKFNKKLR